MTTSLDLFQRGLLSNSPQDTLRYGCQFAQLLPPDVTVTLSGDLGAGKTHFVKGMAQAWHIEEAVTSPTYAIYTPYRGDRQLIHMDAYRLENGRDLDELLIEEFLQTPYCLVVEWPENTQNWLHPPLYPIHITHKEDNQRHIQLKHSS